MDNQRHSISAQLLPLNTTDQPTNEPSIDTFRHGKRSDDDAWTPTQHARVRKKCVRSFAPVWTVLFCVSLKPPLVYIKTTINSSLNDQIA